MHYVRLQFLHGRLAFIECCADLHVLMAQRIAPVCQRRTHRVHQPAVTLDDDHQRTGANGRGAQQMQRAERRFYCSIRHVWVQSNEIVMIHRKRLYRCLGQDYNQKVFFLEF